MDEDVAAVIVEGIQGIGGMEEPTAEFLKEIQNQCKQHGSTFILDEIQSGYGRTGEFFAHQYHPGIRPDLITVAKGMGNGFPVGGVLIAPHFEASYGLLGTTFGGNQLACAASLAVLEVYQKENILEKVKKNGELLINQLKEIPSVLRVRGRGLMIADRKSTRLNSSHVAISYAVFCLKKKRT